MSIYMNTNVAMVWNAVLSDTPVLDNLYGLTVQQLGDESIMTQFDSVAEGRRWYPVVDHSAPLQRYQSYDGVPVLSYEPGALEVIMVRAVRDWTAQEIQDFKVNSIRYITKLAFRNRFTQAEKVAFEMAQVDDPTATQEARLAAAGVRVMEKDLAAGAYADLNAAAVQEGLRRLETIGVLGAGRADEIIWGDIEPYEVP
jgi:hypothetical protein